MKYVALLYFDVAGAEEDGAIGEDHNPETHLIHIVIQVALGKSEFITIYGDDYDTEDGTCVRDYIHVEDLIEAHILAMKYLLNSGESNTFNFGRHIATLGMFDILDNTKPCKGNEIQLTDILLELMKKKVMYAYNFEGRCYDVGDKLGYLEATMEYAIRKPELRDQFIEYLKSIL